MEHTLSTEEKNRLPSASESELIVALGTAALPLVLGMPALAAAEGCVADEDWVNGGTEGTKTLTIANQPDCPRNVTALLTDADDSCTGTLTITGKDCQGRTVVETMSPDGEGEGKTLTGTKIFASVTSAVVVGKGGTTSTDQIRVGYGDVIGVPIDLSRAVQVPNVYLGGVLIEAPVLSTGVSTSGVNASAGTYNGTKALIAYVAVPKLA